MCKKKKQNKTKQKNKNKTFGSNLKSVPNRYKDNRMSSVLQVISSVTQNELS